MAFLSPDSQFQRWTLTDKEVQEGSLLTLTQKQVIQNQIAALAQESIDMIINPEAPGSEYRYSLKQAENKGARDALQYLIDTSNSLESSRNNAPIHTSSQE